MVSVPHAADVAGRLVVGLSGPQLTADERSWLVAYQPAGVILFSRNCLSWNQLAGLCGALHDLVPGLEIMADHEGGPVSQLARALGRPPVAWALGHLDDIPLTARVHAETARRLQDVGVDRVLAPVADVLVEPRNPVIGSRSFGADPDLVTRHVVAAVTGLLEGGVRVCLKHWPGHGASAVDTHQGAADAAGGALAGPFAAGLNAGADAVMVGHVGVEPEGLPATLAAAHLAAARTRLGAGGASVTWYADDVTMGALRGAMAAHGVVVPDGQSTGLVDPAVLPVAWFAALANAGCDRLLVRGLPLAAFPVPDVATSVPAAKPAPDATCDRTHDDRNYDQARARNWATAATGFAAPARDLLWWDLTAGDRWQVAGGDRGSARDLLGPVLEGQFAGLQDLADTTVAGPPCDRLLVTSHRPLPASPERHPRLAASGFCLVLGHPSLAGDMASYLGGGWRVGALWDIAPEDLFRVPES